MKNDMPYNNPWMFSGEPFHQDDVGDYFGFVYLITHTVTNKKYIGKKFFWSRRTLKPLKGTKRKRKIIKESNWKDYYGSCKELIADCEAHGYDSCMREILSIHKDERDVNYSEVKEQFKYNVLEEIDMDNNRVFYNSNILSRYFVRPEFISEDTRRKMSNSHAGKVVTEDTKIKISNALKGKPKPAFTEEHRNNISKSHMGLTAWNKGMSGMTTMSDETKIKLSETHRNLSDDNPAVLSRFKKGHAGYNSGKELDANVKEKISKKLKLTSCFVTDNPNSSDKWITTVIFNTTKVVNFNNFKKYCQENDIKYNALRSWSKQHTNDNLLHPKYGCKILEINKKED